MMLALTQTGPGDQPETSYANQVTIYPLEGGCYLEWTGPIGSGGQQLKGPLVIGVVNDGAETD